MQTEAKAEYGLRPGAQEFPLMVVMSIIYPCNFGCPMCPYTDGNSEIRKFYRERDGDLFPVKLWNSIAEEAGPYQAWMRCTGGGEPMLHPHMVDMIEYAKSLGARIWMNTNGSMFGPHPKQRAKLERVIKAGTDLIEFSMDASDAETYAKLRPPRGGLFTTAEEWWQMQLGNVKAALAIRKELKATTRVVVSIIRQEDIEGKLESAVDFWLNEIGVDEVITRKFLTWDDNTQIPQGKAMDKHLYAELPVEKKEPCVWPFERLNVDTLGRISLCGQDISFRTSELFPNANEMSIKDIWQGEMFTWYRKMHLEGRGAECFPCRGCSAWLAGIRDWDHGWLKVLRTSGEHLQRIMAEDLGAEVEIYTPEAAKKGLRMIDGQAISLRPLESRHLERTRAWVNDPEIARLLDRAKPVSDIEHQKWFASIQESSDCTYFAIETSSGQHIGNIWLHAIDARHRKAELRIMIGELKQAGRGLGSEAIALLTKFAFERLNLHKVYAFVLGINPRARRAFEKAGFSVEGTLRDDRWAGEGYTDVFLLGVLRKENTQDHSDKTSTVEAMVR